MIDWTQPLYIDRISLLRGSEPVTWVDDGEFHHIGDREFRYVYRGDGSRIPFYLCGMEMGAPAYRSPLYLCNPMDRRIKWLIAGVVTVCAGITATIVRAWS